MYKKLIGYKLIKPEYKEASDALLDNACVKWDKAENFRGYYHLILNSETISNLKRAGVLDLWFEPVYEQTITPKYFEIGKWYKLKNYPNSYRRCCDSEIVDNRMKYDQGIVDGKFIYDRSTTNMLFLELLTDLSEIQQYLPEGHIDKIVKHWTNATSEELLAEAKRRYPVGTKFISPHTKKVYTVKDDDFWLGTNKLSVLSPIEEKPNSAGEHVLYNLMWAEIIQETETKTKQIFTKEQEDYIKNLINNEIKKLQ